MRLICISTKLFNGKIAKKFTRVEKTDTLIKYLYLNINRTCIIPVNDGT